MLPKAHRVNSTLCATLIKEGKYAVSEHFTFKYRKTANLGRFSVIVPKKVAALAVDRNALRRHTVVFIDPKVPLEGIFIYKKRPQPEDFSKKIPEEVHSLLAKATQ